MTRIVICGGPRTGKTTLADQLQVAALDAWVKEHGSIVDLEGPVCMRSDDVITLGWSEASQRVSEWLDAPGPWIIEGVAVCRALRKWREAHPGEPPVDKVIRLTAPHVALTKRQAAMAKGEETVWQEIEQWLLHSGVTVAFHARLDCDPSDGYEAAIRYWANFPRRTHKVMCLGKHIGDVWDNGAITMRDDEPQVAPPVRADHDG
jgi:hypothetical protein